HYRSVGRKFYSDSEIGSDLDRGGRARTDPKRITSIGDALEQEEAVEVRSRRTGDGAAGIHQLQIDALEPELTALHQRPFDAAAADQSDLHVGGDSRPWHDHLQRLFWGQHRIIQAGHIDS